MNDLLQAVSEFADKWGFGGMFFLICLLQVLLIGRVSSALRDLRKDVQQLNDVLIQALLGRRPDDSDNDQPKTLRMWPRSFRGDESDA